ncbi:hypothetical protein PVAP13_9KG564730, partial [Panicum virgatum]
HAAACQAQGRGPATAVAGGGPRSGAAAAFRWAPPACAPRRRGCRRWWRPSGGAKQGRRRGQAAAEWRGVSASAAGRLRALPRVDSSCWAKKTGTGDGSLTLRWSSGGSNGWRPGYLRFPARW